MERCSSSNAINPVKTFTDAIKMIKNGESAEAVYNLLCKVARFKLILETESIQPT
jgi:hypothetical protein